MLSYTTNFNKSGVNSRFRRYLSSSGKLDYQLLYKDLASYTGFRAKEKREVLYGEVKSWYNELKDN
jgi:hypothetical protein|tara:strand:+ start:426 stop:623 length:198 start_codon:yes stop_codon:yes gene_type:complete